MEIKILSSFADKLAKQVEYIAKNKPQAARKFKKDVLLKIRTVSSMPYKYKKSIYFDSEDIRDMVFKGYCLVYRIKQNENIIEFFGFVKHQEGL